MINVALALPFSLGIVTAINPCGFAMLPTWLGYFIGRESTHDKTRAEQVVHGLWVSLLLTITFAAVFGLLGLIVSHIVAEETIARRTPWITAAIGLIFIPYGFAQLIGKPIKFSIFKKIRAPKSTEFLSILGFGVSYAVVSVGCAAPLFLLQIAGSFSREGIINGTAVYLAYAAGMGAVVISLTLSIALARGGLVRNMKLLVPFIDRIGALSLIIGGAYLTVYGIYEIRILNDVGTASNPVVDAVSTLQAHLTTWIAESGGLRVGLSLWLLIAGLTIWGFGPAFTARARTTSRIIIGGLWIFIELLGYQGNLIFLPLLRLFFKWPDRISGWFDDPIRWAVPLEVLLTITFLLTLGLSISATIKRKRW